jgi:hypothetical protein
MRCLGDDWGMAAHTVALAPALSACMAFTAQSMKVADARERVPIANKARALNLFFDIECLETITGMAGEMAPQLPADTVLAVARLTPSAQCLTTSVYCIVLYSGPSCLTCHGLCHGLAGEVKQVLHGMVRSGVQGHAVRAVPHGLCAPQRQDRQHRQVCYPCLCLCLACGACVPCNE